VCKVHTIFIKLMDLKYPALCCLVGPMHNAIQWSICQNFLSTCQKLKNNAQTSGLNKERVITIVIIIMFLVPAETHPEFYSFFR